MRGFFILIFLAGSLVTFKASSDATFWINFIRVCKSSGHTQGDCVDRVYTLKRHTKNKGKRSFFIDCFNYRCSERNFENCVFLCFDWAKCMAEAGWFARTFGSPCE